MAQYEQERLLNEILPNVAAQLRGPLGNMHVAILRMTPQDMGWHSGRITQEKLRCLHLQKLRKNQWATLKPSCGSL